MVTTRRTLQQVPLTNAIIIAIGHLFDPNREPSHYDIELQIKRCKLEEGDPKPQAQVPIGKVKRVTETLNWAMDNEPEKGEILAANLISIVRGRGGFRSDSPNYVGEEAIKDIAAALKTEGFILTEDGELFQELIDHLSGALITEELRRYARRAKQGVRDAALLVGTGKDLLEATAGHILVERYGSYSTGSNFPTLLAQAFIALSMATSKDAPTPGEPPQKNIERAMYDLGCAINRLRNKEGTGHGRPWPLSVTDSEAKSSVEMMGIIADRLLQIHEVTP